MEITKLMRQAVLPVQRLSPSILTFGIMIAVFLFAVSPATASYLETDGNWNGDHSVYHAYGYLSDANDLFKIQLELPRSATVAAETTSWSKGNFDPVLWLFNPATGAQKDKNDDILPIPDPNPKFDLDARIQTTLNAGTYLFVVSTFDQHFCLAGDLCNGQVYNTPGWSYNGNFDDRGQWAALDLNFGASQGGCGSTLPKITLSIDHNPPHNESNTPEPASAWLLLIGGALVGIRKFRRAR